MANTEPIVCDAAKDELQMPVNYNDSRNDDISVYRQQLIDAQAKHRCARHGLQEVEEKCFHERELKEECQSKVSKLVSDSDRARAVVQLESRELKVTEQKHENQVSLVQTAHDKVNLEQERCRQSTEDHQKSSEVAEASNLIYSRQHEIAMEADRNAEKWRARYRRSKELHEAARVKALTAVRNVARFRAPIETLEANCKDRLKKAEELEIRALETRERLSSMIESELESHQKYKASISQLPKALIDRDKGYLEVEEQRQVLAQKIENIRIEEYQKAYFRRDFKNALPSPIDGSVIEHVGVVRAKAWLDPWGERGIGPDVISLHVNEMLELQHVEEVEKQLQDAKLAYETVHDEILLRRDVNERVYAEARKRREISVDFSKQLQSAQQKLAKEIQIADECAELEEKYLRQMEEHEAIVEDAEKYLSICMQDRNRCRAEADLAASQEEGCKRRLNEALNARNIAVARLTEENGLLDRLKNSLRDRRAHAAKSMQVESALKVELHTAQEQLEEHAALLADAERSAASFQQAESEALMSCQVAKNQLDHNQRRLEFKSRLTKRNDNLDLLEQHALAYIVAANEIHDRNGGTRDHEFEYLVQTGSYLSSVAMNDGYELRRKVKDGELVDHPANRNNWPLRVKESARVFQVVDDGATLQRVTPTCRPAGVKAWVSQYPEEAGRSFSAILDKSLSEGRHAWDCHIQSLAGQGVLLVGVMSDPHPPTARQDGLGGGGARRWDKEEACGVGRIDVNGYCIGEDEGSWGLASDGVVMHGGKAQGYAGQGLKGGDVVTCLVEWEAGRVSWLLDGSLVASVPSPLPPPLVPALSVTRTVTCHVTFSNYRRWCNVASEVRRLVRV